MTQMPRWLTAPHQRTGRVHQGVLVSRGWTLSSEIWQPTTSHWTKQSTWLRTVLCGGWCLHMALRTPSGACQKRRRRRPFVPKENLLSNLVHVFIYVMTENKDSPSMCWAVVELKWHFCFVSLSFVTYDHHTTTILWPLFRDHSCEPVPEENFWTLWCKGRLTEADTLTIGLGATPSRLINQCPPPLSLIF